MVGFSKALAVVGAVAQVAADSSVYVRDNEHLHFPKETVGSSFELTLSEEDVSFLVARVAGSRAPLESKPPSGLPVPDLFHRQAGSLVLLVTGSEAALTSEPSYRLEDTSSTPSQAIARMLTGGSASTSRKTGEAGIAAGVCASLCKSVASACAADATVVTWDAESQSFGDFTVDTLFNDDALFNGVGVTIDSDSQATHTATGTTLDLTDDSTVKMLAELQLFFQLPTLLKDSLPRSAVLSAVGPQMFEKEHGSDSASLEAVDAIVNAATDMILDAWNTAYDNDAYEVAILRHNVAADVANRRRILATSLSNGTSTNSTSSYTWEDVEEYQLFTWTWFLLLLVVFFAACMLGGLDIGNDDAGLYSNFKATNYDRAIHEHDQ